MPNELKPCPFCGGEARIIENKYNLNNILYGVCCFDGYYHSASVWYFNTIEEAIETWNRKANDEF